MSDLARLKKKFGLPSHFSDATLEFGLAYNAMHHWHYKGYGSLAVRNAGIAALTSQNFSPEYAEKVVSYIEQGYGF
jgi:hypothetical protein